MKISFALLILAIVTSCSKKELERTALEFGKNDPTEIPDKPSNEGGGDTPTDGTNSDNNPPGPKYTTPVAIEFTWDIPTKREDDSALALNEINGYRFYFGFKEDEWEPAIEISGGPSTLYNFLIDADDNYYFAISTVDSDNVEGKKSAALKASCIDKKCTIVSLPVKPPSIISSTSESNRIRDIDDSNSNASSNEVITPQRIAAQEICPAFPLRNIKKNKIEYYANNIRVSSQGYNPQLIQCGWRRYHDEQSKKAHLVGLPRLNLHLPIYRNGNAFVINKKLYIPYDITSMSAEQKTALALKLGANKDGLDIERSFLELPLQLSSTYSENTSIYDEKRISGDFAIINDSTFATTSTSYLPACEVETVEALENDDEATTPIKDCYNAESLLKKNLERSPFLLSNLNNKRLPVLAITFDMETDVEKLMKEINENTSSLKLYQLNNTGAYNKRYINFNFSPAEDITRINFSKIVIKQDSKIEILNQIFKFNHKMVNEQALNYATTLISDKINITPTELLNKVPNITNFLMDIWNAKPAQGEKEDFEKKNKALAILDYLYSPVDNPVGAIAQFYRVMNNYYYQAEKRIIRSQFLSEQTAGMVDYLFSIVDMLKGLQFSNGIALDKAFEWTYGESVVDEKTIKRIVALSKTYKEALSNIDQETRNTDEDDINTQYNIPIITLIDRIQDLVVNHEISDELIATHIKLFKILYHYKYNYAIYPDEYRYEDEYVGITSDFMTFAFNSIKSLLIEHQIKENQLVLFEKTLAFLYEKNYVNMYSFADALEKTKKLIFEQELSLSKFYAIKNNFSFWTSRQETFLSDTVLALELAQNAVLADEITIQRYRDLRNFYSAFTRYPRTEFPLNDRRNALKYAYEKVIDQKMSHESAQLGISIISWFSNELAATVSFEQTKRKYQYYRIRKRISQETFNALKESYYEQIKLGKTSKRALAIAERKHL